MGECRLQLMFQSRVRSQVSKQILTFLAPVNAAVLLACPTDTVDPTEVQPLVFQPLKHYVNRL